MSAHPSNAPRTAGTLQGLILLLPITLLAVMGIAVLVPVVPQLMAHFKDVPNYCYLIQGGVLTMPALCVTLFSSWPLAGWLADRFGRRRILIVSHGHLWLSGCSTCSGSTTSLPSLPRGWASACARQSL